MGVMPPPTMEKLPKHGISHYGLECHLRVFRTREASQIYPSPQGEALKT